ncbi:MAG: hypothetical protein A4E36_01855 [Methanoregulaceae archaeon PtaB.Bin009]|nr:MAG: hypothetical protein A4E36_01855 [Methanoregulaceae archaeon PtaB.Bin009]HNQ30477.1 hypothetical protein [Methanolinea sp.]
MANPLYSPYLAKNAFSSIVQSLSHQAFQEPTGKYGTGFALVGGMV